MFGPRAVVWIKYWVNKYVVLLIGIALIFVQLILVSETYFWKKNNRQNYPATAVSPTQIKT
jgi:hypothetical protein